MFKRIIKLGRTQYIGKISLIAIITNNLSFITDWILKMERDENRKQFTNKQF
jgi:hypothetical protein